MMGTAEKLCLQWNDFEENITTSFRELREDKDFTDVTLACEDGQQIEAHKVVLASSSPCFMELLKKNNHPHPFIYMRGLRVRGEANVLQNNLDSFLVLAEEMRLKGQTGGAETEKEPTKEIPQTKTVPPKKEICQNIEESQSESKSKGVFFNESCVPVVAVTNDKISADLQDLDQQIMSMITKSEVSAGNGQGKMATCNICGKQGPFHHMPNHIEANHITGLSHACDICGKVSR